MPVGVLLREKFVFGQFVGLFRSGLIHAGTIPVNQSDEVIAEGTTITFGPKFRLPEQIFGATKSGVFAVHVQRGGVICCRARVKRRFQDA